MDAQVGTTHPTTTNPTTTATKRTLSTLSAALEEVAASAGPDATVLATFQHAAYFRPVRRRYEDLAAGGATVVVAHAGDGPRARGVHRVVLEPNDPIVRRWSLVVVTPQLACHVDALDRIDLEPSEADLESGRMFACRWGFGRRESLAHARELRDLLAPSLDDALVGAVDDAIDAARRVAVTLPEVALGHAAQRLARSLDRTQRTVAELRSELAEETRRATTDSLTGLRNREGVERWLGGPGVAGVRMPPVGLVLLDLDGFKAVNDDHGHQVGDRLLVAVAEAISDVVRPGDVAARWGGDEFLVLCPMASEAQLSRIADRLVDAVAAVRVEGVSVGVSAGVQLTSSRPLPLDGADAALYRAKAAGGGTAVAAVPAP